MRKRSGESRLYSVLLRLVPPGFRARQGRAMAQAFASLRLATRERGRAAVLRLYVTEALDLLRTGLMLRLRALGVARWWRGRRGAAMGSGGRSGDLRGSRVIALVDDTRLAWRAAFRHRAFFLFASVTFALGVGAMTATYSGLKSLVLDPLPFPGAERVVLVWRTIGSGWFSPGEPEVEALAADREVFEEVALFNTEDVLLTGSGAPVRLTSVQMGANLVEFMGVRPVLGRVFTETEYGAGASRVLLLSHALWRGQFGGARDVLGRALMLNGESWTIIGVMAAGAVRPNGAPGRVDVWMPLPATTRYRQAIARLRPGVTLEAASTHAGELFRRVSGTDSYGARVTSATALRSGALQEPLRVLMVAVTLLLLVACVNVSNLLLQRAAGRGHEVAVLSALGAGRFRLARQFLMESVMLALAGGAMGTLLAAAFVRLVQWVRPAELNVLELISLDGGALVFSLVVSTVAGLLFGLLPSIRAAGADAMASLARAPREGRLVRGRIRWTLVAAQVAFSFALLVGAMQLIVSLQRSAGRDPGFRAERLLDITITMPAWRYGEQATLWQAIERMTDRIRRLPRVEAVALGGGSPAESGIYFGTVQVEGQPAEPQASMFYGNTIAAEYLAVVAQPLVAGRDFTTAEISDSANVVILGESSARRLFPAGAIGQRLSIGGGPPHLVVGVVRDAALGGLSSGETIDIAYWPMTSLAGTLHLLVRTRSEEAGLVAELRGIIHAIEPDALVDATSATDRLRRSLARERFTTTLLAGFAALALFLSGVGLYSVLSHVVAARTHEIGVRVSLGADARRIRQLVLRSGLTATVIGLGLGGLLLWGGLQWLRSRLHGLSENDPAVWVAAALTIGAVALVAVWQPARRAARIDPMLAMRAD
jgi:predicted permease